MANGELWSAAALARDNRIGAWPELAAELSARLGWPITSQQLSETARKNRGSRSAEARRRACQAVLDTMAWAKAPDSGDPPDLEAANPELLPAPRLRLLPAETAEAAEPPPGWLLAADAEALSRRQQRRRYRRLRRLVLIDGTPRAAGSGVGPFASTAPPTPWPAVARPPAPRPSSPAWWPQRPELELVGFGGVRGSRG